MTQRQLILMRHATAEPGMGHDRDRELTASGKDDAHRIGIWLGREGPIPTLILCSTALRCRETHAALIAGLGRKEIPVEFEERLYNAPTDALLDSLTDLSITASPKPGVDHEEVVLLIAHNPGISHLALDLVLDHSGAEAATAALRGGFSPATTAFLDFSGNWSSLAHGSARLTRFMLATEV